MGHLGGGNQEGVVTAQGGVEDREVEDGEGEEGPIRITDDQILYRIHQLTEDPSQMVINGERKMKEHVFRR